MQRAFVRIWAVLLAASGLLAGNARADTTVEVLETDPAGETVTLGKGERFHLRLAYASDTPVRIWAQPFFRGEPARAGSSPSVTYSGTGEALGWFFLFEAGDQVDEVRIQAGDGSRDGTRLVTRYPVRVVGSARRAAARTPPAWVADLRQQSEAAMRSATAQAAATPSSAGGVALFGVLACGMIAAALGGLAAPLWGLWRFRGLFRAAALLPSAALGYVVLRIAVDVARDPTSHNLWPFELLQAGVLSLAFMGALALARRSLEKT